MDQDSTHIMAASKVPMLKLGEYELWRIRMEQYIQMIDYSLWEVIENGNSAPKTKLVEGVETTIAPATTKEKAQRRLELMARSTLLMGIPNEHQLKFNSIKDAKSLLQAVKKRFGGNAATKKTQRNLLKQQYENFTASSSEVLDQTFDRFQKLFSQLEIHGENISQEDVNQKFLRSLSPERNTHTIVRRNKPEIDTLSLDDLFNNLKIYEPEVKGTSSTNTNTQQEMDLRWQMAMLTIRERRFLKKTGRKFSVNGNETIGFGKSKVECYNCHKMGHFSRECRAPRNQENKNRENTRMVVPVETTTNALISCDGAGYDWSDQAEEGPTNFALMAYSSTSSNSEVSTDSNCSSSCLENVKILKEQNEQLLKDLRTSKLNAIAYKTGLESVEARLLVYKKNESVYEEDIKVLKREIHLREVAITELRRKLELAQKQKDEIQLTVEKFENSSKSLSKLIDCQIVDKCKTGLGYNVVPPPYTGNFMPPKPDLSFSGLEEFVNEPIVSEPTVKKPVVETSEAKASADKPKGNPQQYLQEKGVIDSGCSRHMTWNMSYLTNFKEIDKGYVAFEGNPKGRKITGRGTIKTGNLDFENVYFVRELKFNLFSVSQMCDKKNSFLFNDTEYIVLSPNFKLTDESHVLLKVSRKNNMYSVDLKNIVPKGGLTFLFAKSTSDEYNLWHRRLGHINFKTMNKLVKGNLVRGLPSKLFENNQTCVACQNGKQHRASCKTKTVSSISQPLHMLHMDLFVPTFVKSLMKKMYCLVVTDDYNRFSWVFFLATKDETSGILKSFITRVENLIDQKVKVIRCDNGNEFKNKEMNQFCERNAKTVNGEEQLQALVDRKKVIITEASIRRDVQLEDAEGINCLPNATIFEELTRMSAKTTTWNEFSSTMASAIICLATNQKFNFSKYVVESLVKNLNNDNKFLMYPRFVQVFLDKQVGDMSTHDQIYPSHTNKVFRNMKRVGKGFSKVVTPLFPTMMVQAYEEMGEGSANPINPHHTPTITQPSTSQPQKKQKPRKPKKKDTKIPQSSSPTEPIVDESANEENVPTHSNDPLLSGEDRLKLQEWIELYEDMFGVNNLEGDEVVVESDVAAKKKDDEVNVVKEVVSTAGDTAPVNAATITTVKLTLAQTLAELKSARPKAKGLVIPEQEPSESITTTTTKTTTGILLQELSKTRTTTTPAIPSKDKGKGIMVEEPLKMKKKDQISFDQQEAIRLQAQFDEEARIAREKEKANAALIAYWNDIQDKVETDYELAQRLQQEEQEELTIEEKSKLFVQLLEKRRKHFAAKRA
ncbi:putative ribonuclease H-like domain-containing protein [Tanacetum coccineum]